MKSIYTDNTNRIGWKFEISGKINDIKYIYYNSKIIEKNLSSFVMYSKLEKKQYLKLVVSILSVIHNYS